jgi:hypothetical protein
MLVRSLVDSTTAPAFGGAGHTSPTGASASASRPRLEQLRASLEHRVVGRERLARVLDVLLALTSVTNDAIARSTVT